MTSTAAPLADHELPVLPECRRFALMGSPNSGKTTVFNALTGMRSKTANYAGVTVDCSYGFFEDEQGRQAQVIDLPGTYSLEPLSPEETLAVDFLHGRIPGQDPLYGIVFVADSTSLARSLPMLGGILELGIPTVLTLTMVDEIEARKGKVEVGELRRRLGIPVVPVIGNRGIGIEDLKRTLLDEDGPSPPLPSVPVPAEPGERFEWADRLLEETYRSPQRGTPLTDLLDRFLLHPVTGILSFAAVMVFFFQAIFSWAVPMMDALDEAAGWLGSLIEATVPPGLLQDLLADGIVAGVGSVVVFVPQIALLFLLLTFFEQAGYMSRAVFVVDRLMSWVGLDGRSFVALLSSYACAIPGIMSARAIPDPRQRLATILVAPFMTCSARLPVYTLLIAAFIPHQEVLGVFNLQGLVMLGLYLLGAITALAASALLRRGPLAGQSMPFYVELPPYRWPTAKVLLRGVWMPVSRFLRRAGTVILVASMVLWALIRFPQTEAPTDVSAQGQSAVASYQLEQSLAGRFGRLLEPVFEPLGFDWRVTVGIVSSLAAREVVVATLAQIYAVEEEDEAALRDVLKLRLAPSRDGSRSSAGQLAVAISMLVFFVFALQCISTVAVMRRETGSWLWPLAAYGVMFALAYGASFVAYRLTLWLASPV